jgi:hypothetical protein
MGLKERDFLHAIALPKKPGTQGHDPYQGMLI